MGVPASTTIKPAIPAACGAFAPLLPASANPLRMPNSRPDACQEARKNAFALCTLPRRRNAEPSSKSDAIARNAQA